MEQEPYFRVCIPPGKKQRIFKRSVKLNVDIINCDPDETCIETGQLDFG